MSDATPAATSESPQNWVLYRIAALMFQPGYTYQQGETPVVPAPVVYTPAGEVILTVQVVSGESLIAPDGYRYALDAQHAYPVGSVFPQ